MNLLQYQRPNNPLKLLDDYLSSISSPTSTNIQGERTDNDDSDAIINDATAVADATITSSSSPEIAEEQHQQQHLHNSVLRAANELFGNNITLLENSLALLEEQEEYQNNDGNDGNDVTTIAPIRTIRARRSGRVAVLVRKQQKKKSRSSQSGKDKHSTDDYYLCLLGRDKLTFDSTHSAIRTSQGTYLCTPQHRIGMHCTCRSFFHNVKGVGTVGGSGRYKSNDERSPTRSNSSSSSNSNKSNIVCKHLLAVILMPHLLPWRKDGVEEDIVDDKMFAKLVMKASVG